MAEMSAKFQRDRPQRGR